VVLDADGLTLLAANRELTERSVAQLVVTPHPGEAARLLGISTAEVEADRFSALEILCERLGATAVLKGAPSLVGDTRLSCVAPAGHPCLATAGTGDVLAGVIGALGGQLTALNAALAGTWLHAMAGEQLGSGRFGGRGALAREVADQVPELCASLCAR
jgi:NAD(P)H-hydrate epimerase